MTEARSAIDIAKEIIEEIRKASPAADESEIDIYDVIMGLRKLYPLAPFRGYRKENAKRAAQLIRWIDEGQALLASTPDAASPEKFFINVPLPGEDRASQFNAILGAMRDTCDWIIQSKRGVHGLSGYQQERAAVIARGLMEKYGLPLAYSSPTSAYRTTARLFFEGMTVGTLDGGEDIERACKVVAQLPMMQSIEVFARL